VRVWYATLLKTKKKNEKSIENKSKFYSEVNYKNGHISKKYFRYCHKNFHTSFIDMPKTQNLIFPHLDPFSEPWSHMWMKARKCFIFYSKNFSKYFDFKEINWSLFNSYVKQYDSTINEAILETYSIKREMYYAWKCLFICQLPAIGKGQIHLSIYRCQVVFTRDNWWLMDVYFLWTLHMQY
jgi:hypothetical protein